MLRVALPRYVVIALPIVFLVFIWACRLVVSGPLVGMLPRPPLHRLNGTGLGTPSSGDDNTNNNHATRPGLGASGLLGLPGPPVRPSIDLADAEAPFIAWPLQRLCSETQWTPGLVYICDNNSGGIGNIRNYIQTCVRYALEVGATGLVMPRIRKRSETDLADLFASYLPFGYMFDEQHFRDAMASACPQMALHDTLANVRNAGENPDSRIELITPKDFGNREGCDPRDMNRHTDQFGDTFRAWLQNMSLFPTIMNTGKNFSINYPPPSVEKPRFIRFNWGVLFDWDAYRDGPEFYATFGSILKFNETLIHLGKRVVARVREVARTNHALAAAENATAAAENILPSPIEGGGGGATTTNTINERYMGIHLRTESDVVDFWPKWDEQVPGYLHQARLRGFKTALLATGNASEAARFKDVAKAEAGLSVYTAADLLSAEDRARLDELSWDQRGVVDFVALLESDFFTGVSPSSYSIWMAMRRHLRLDGLYTRPYRFKAEGDGLSWMAGRFDRYWDHWLYMWQGMWP